MIVRYRLFESRWRPNGPWETFGFFYENKGTLFLRMPIRYAIYVHEPVEILQYIERNIEQEQLHIEDAERAVGKYKRRYRVCPEILSAEGDTFREIVQKLEYQYLGVRPPKTQAREELRVRPLKTRAHEELRVPSLTR
jgi:hypothetical protein